MLSVLALATGAPHHQAPHHHRGPRVFRQPPGPPGPPGPAPQPPAERRTFITVLLAAEVREANTANN